MILFIGFFPLVLYFISTGGASVSICNAYLSDPEACLHKTKTLCQWSSLSSSCVSTKSFSLGCDPSLNRFSCQKQLSDPQGLPVTCFFGLRCQVTNADFLDVVDCNPNLSKYACLSVTTPQVKCQWKYGFCQSLSTDIKILPDVESTDAAQEILIQRCSDTAASTTSSSGVTSSSSTVPSSSTSSAANSSDTASSTDSTTPSTEPVNNCKLSTDVSVNQNACSELNNGSACYHGDLQADFKCLELSKTAYATSRCNTPGLNQKGCLLISTPGELCIFQVSKCRNILSSDMLTCTSLINREACIGITDPNQKCSWDSVKNTCKDVVDFDLECDKYPDSSVSTCQALTQECVYEPKEGGCRSVSTDANTGDSCSAAGVSEKGCMALQRPCRYEGNCQSVEGPLLFYYRCNQNLNENACYQLLTKGETCQWNTVFKECVKVQVVQSDNCLQRDHVNGNVCRSITNQGCKFDKVHSCTPSSPTKDSCLTPFLNIQGCVEVLRANNICQWNTIDQICQTVQVISGVTGCRDLTNVNPAACSLVSRPEKNPDLLNCKHDVKARGCVTFTQPTAQDKKKESYVPVTCEESGMNVYGCVTVDTYPQTSRCKWQVTNCVTIHSQVEIQSLSCISMQLVNSASCTWVVGGGERCKYEPVSHNCIPTVNIQTDRCSTLGINAYGCASLVNANCYYDTVSSRCSSTDELSEAEQAEFYGSALCAAEFPTKENCLSITTMYDGIDISKTQLCFWDFQLSLCIEVTPSPKDQCTDFTNVNYNVCAAVLPLLVTPEKSYCVHDPANYKCIVQTTPQRPCSANGFNQYSCSAMTESNSYCYFDLKRQRCLQYGSASDIKTVADANTFFYDMKVECVQLNAKGCKTYNANVNQRCFFKGRCLNIDFQNDSINAQYKCNYFQEKDTTSNQWVCASVIIDGEFCIYDSLKFQCANVTAAKCSDSYQNVHSCLFKTDKEYCQWDQSKLQCSTIPALQVDNQVCTNPINQNMCNNVVKGPCKFTVSTAKCASLTVSAGTQCSTYAQTGSTYNLLACQQIDTDGQFCSYNPATSQCQTQSKTSSNCVNPGFNRQSCFGRTSKQCYWNTTKKSCGDLAELLTSKGFANIDQLACDSNINKVVCLKITKVPCQWSEDLGKCTPFPDSSTTTLANVDGTGKLNFNVRVCIAVTSGGTPVSWDSANFVCQEVKTKMKTCTTRPVNKHACALMTKGYCTFNTDLACVVVPDDQINTLKCTDPINYGICLDNTSYACQWTSTGCSSVTVGTKECSAFVSGALYSLKVCVAVNSGVEYPRNSQTKKSCDLKSTQPDFCAFNAATNLCVQLADYVGGKYDVAVEGLPDELGNPTYTTETVDTCSATQYAKCLNNINKVACLQLTSVECVYLDIGGCQAPASYNGPKCTESNPFACTKITTPLQQCLYDVDNNKCTDYSSTDPIADCDKVVGYINPNVCSALAFDLTSVCLYDASNWTCIKASTKTKLSCTTPGLNKKGCLDLISPTCTFASGQCKGTVVDRIIATCEDANKDSVNVDLTDATTIGLQCSAITAQKQLCFVDGGKCKSAAIADLKANKCSELDAGVDPSKYGNINTCINTAVDVAGYDGGVEWCKFDPPSASCLELDATTGQGQGCPNLNKAACKYATVQTTPINCAWQKVTTDVYQCYQLSKNDLTSLNVMDSVEGCDNFSTTTCLAIQLKYSCQLDVDKITCKSFTDTATKCVDIAKDSKWVNEVSCAIQTKSGADKLYCFFKFTAAKSPDSAKGQCLVAKDKINCSSPGLSYYACLELTWVTVVDKVDVPQECYWDSDIKKCYLLTDPSYYATAKCEVLNKTSCPKNVNPGKACVWSTPDLLCKEQSTIANCDTYTSFTSQFTCAKATDSACKYDVTKGQCLKIGAAESLTCSVAGINQIGCVTSTTGNYCQWIAGTFTCQTLPDLDGKVCTDVLNQDACIGIDNKTCYFKKTDKTCNELLITDATTADKVTDTTILIGASSCSKITEASKYLAYDATNSVCKLQASASSYTLACNAAGLNRLACLGRTGQTCVYDQNSCYQITELGGLSCSLTYSLNTCINIPGVGCTYDTSTDKCESLSATDKCQSIADSAVLQTNSYVCAIQADSCFYDVSTNKCKILNAQYSQCNQYVVSKSACIKFTTNKCAFRNNACVAEADTKNYLCTDPINQPNCQGITTNNQLCQFDTACKIFDVQLTTGCPDLFVNPAVCVRITKEPCIFGSNLKCKNIDTTTKCLDPYINKLGCQWITKNGEFCAWDQDTLSCFEADLTAVSCIQVINIGTCLNLTTPAQVCLWQSSSNQCFGALEGMQCSELSQVNSYKACALASDLCVYDKDNENACIAVTSKDDYPCNYEGLSKEACLNKTKDKKPCLYDERDNFCFLPSNLTECDQAPTEADCVGVLNLCKWAPEEPCEAAGACPKCKPYDSSLTNCNDTQIYKVTRQVCIKAKITDKNRTCSYDIQTNNCMEKTPEACVISQDPNSCVHLLNNPCIWNNTKLCYYEEIKYKPGQYTCEMLGANAAQSTCLDLVRAGEYCQYLNNKCQAINPTSITQCDVLINYNACVAISGSLDCFWDDDPVKYTFKVKNYGPTPKLATTLIDVFYRTGRCATFSFSMFDTMSCSQNLNQNSCLKITTPGAYCQWFGVICQPVRLSKDLHPLPIKIDDYVLVNQNVCTLVNDGTAVKYDLSKNGCMPSDPVTDDCEEPGLNREGCLTIQSQQCSWEPVKKTCMKYTLPVTINSCSEITDVSYLVCQRITTADLMCVYDADNFECVDKDDLSNCTDVGVNKLSCLSMANDTCEWRDDQCFNIDPIGSFTKCDDFKNPVNPFTCAQVAYMDEMCKYNSKTSMCQSISEITNEKCSDSGLNLRACQGIETDYCVFESGRCISFIRRDSSCNQVGLTNPLSCQLVKQPVDSCKYNFVTGNCSQSGINDQCSTLGLNGDACSQIKGCYWIDATKNCGCKLLDDSYPPCSLLPEYEKCSLRSDCYYIGATIDKSKYKVQFKIEEYLLKKQVGTCKPITCDVMTLKTTESTEASTTGPTTTHGLPVCVSITIIRDLDSRDPLGNLCFQSSSENKCMIVNSCEQISKVDLTTFYPKGCAEFTFNGMQCLDGVDTCQTFTCSTIKTESDCKQHSEHCVFTQPDCAKPEKFACLPKECEDHTEEMCKGNMNSRACSWVESACKGFKTCEHVNELTLPTTIQEQTCNSIFEDHQYQIATNISQCGWVLTSTFGTTSTCSPIPCRYMGSSIKQCVGMHVFNTVCVLGKDLSCQSCEEITDSCTCLQNKPYCEYERHSERCLSVACSTRKTKKECRSGNVSGQQMCRFNLKEKKCKPQCFRVFSKTACIQDGCTWDDSSNICDKTPVIPPAPVLVQPSEIYSPRMGWPLVALLIMIFGQ